MLFVKPCKPFRALSLTEIRSYTLIFELHNLPFPYLTYLTLQIDVAQKLDVVFETIFVGQQSACLLVKPSAVKNGVLPRIVRNLTSGGFQIEEELSVELVSEYAEPLFNLLGGNNRSGEVVGQGPTACLKVI